LTVAAPIETIQKAGGEHWSTNAHTVDVTLSPTTLLSFRLTGTWNPSQYSRPLTGDATTPYRVDTGTGLSCCGVMQISHSESLSRQWHVKLNKYVQRARVTHDLRGGVQLTTNKSWNASAWPSGVRYSDLNGQPDQATFQGPSQTAGNSSSQGVWIEDQLTVGRLTVSVGVRADRMNVTSPDRPVYDLNLRETDEIIKGLGEMFTENVVAPRFGGNIRLREDGKATVRFSAGRSYGDVPSASNVYPGIAKQTLARWSPATNSYSTIVSVTDPTANLRYDSDMKLTYQDSFSIGVDHEVRTNLSVGATFVYKHGEDQVGWKDIGGTYGTRTDVLPDGRTVTVFPLLSPTSSRIYLRTNCPGCFNTYKGLVLTVDKRFSARWQVNGSYTRGSARGLITTGQDPNDDVNNVGYLSPQDRPHMASAVITYNIPKIDVPFAASYMYMGGRPWAPQAQINLPQGRRSVNIDSPGSYRYSAQNLLHFRATKALFRVRDHRVQLNFMLLNVLQDTGEQTYVTRNFYSANFAAPASWIIPRQAYFTINIR
jgi:hypothetical protein